MHDTHFSFTDKLCLQFDTALRTLLGKPQTTGRENPAKFVKEQALSETERRHSQGYMRVNHCGEVCAQALYQGQAFTARKDTVKQEMQQAAIEENDHLSWCETRLKELNSHTSYLNPIWYLGSLTLGIAAGIAGDKWSLGFLAETEKQVTTHLHKHMKVLPEKDKKSFAIVAQMAEDESEHANKAIDAGAADLPDWIKTLMRVTAKAMTTTAYYF